MTGASAVVRVEVEPPYDVVIGHAVLPSVAEALPSSTRRVAIVRSLRLADPAALVRQVLVEAGYDAFEVEVPDGEAAKTPPVAVDCWRRLAELGLSREDAVVGVGGGATTDLAGFVAATFLRGVPVVHVPTSLVAMVDAAVGGKTGINLALGKNLVGAVHQPAGVVCDLGLLSTLSRRDLAAGLAEVVKCGFIADPEILDRVEADVAEALDCSSPSLAGVVERAVGVKAWVVAADPLERPGQDAHPGRAVLNYGHTFGHAVELVESYRLRHGEAVAIGMVFAAELAAASGLLAPEVVARHRRVLAALGLPTSYDGSWTRVRAALSHDKKNRGGRLRFVVLEDIGAPVWLEHAAEDALEAAFAAVSASPQPG